MWREASGGRAGSSALSVTTRCCCEIRREVGTGGGHAHSLTFQPAPCRHIWQVCRRMRVCVRVCACVALCVWACMYVQVRLHACVSG